MFKFKTSVESPLQYYEPMLDFAGSAETFILSTPEYYRMMQRTGGFKGLSTYGFWVPSERERAGRQRLVIE